ncbi:aldose 1-epimerase family protein [Lachnoclostridium sp. Marseille-P6806]|uniref:aldose 1-epimerase family protein n=1 Tax=Lachnoclostridium sp. Marseille-P6806 TaxID=2364793 RepID=UPI00102FABC4|nr:aldose 1-epimerase family protein [Lachnoclostridium sp. Marseille-P6806]
MNFSIGNGMLQAELSSVGAELRSLRDAEGHEYLWQGDPAWWKGRAPQLFPWVGRLTNGIYQMDGRTASFGIHGFLREMELEAAEHTAEAVTFCSSDTAKTRAQYDRKWELRIRCEVRDRQLLIRFFVENRDARVMYFGYGGHPGFFVPMEEGLSFEDYYLDFEEKAEPVQLEITAQGFVGEKETPYSLRDGHILPLRHELFVNDAVVLRGMAHGVTIRSDRGRRCVTVRYPQMDYLGIWQSAGSDTPFLCIEPWVSLPSRQDVPEVLEKRKDLVRLLPGECYENCWSIELG